MNKRSSLSLSDAEQRRLDPRAERSRTALRAALGQMLITRPVDQITILALTRQAGVGYATFFRNYSDIDDVLADLSGALIAELSALVTPVAKRAGYHGVASAIARFAEERRSLLAPLFVGASASLEREIIAKASAVAAANGRVPNNDVPDSVAISHSVGVVINLLSWWLGEDPAPSKVRLSSLIDRLAFQPLEPSTTNDIEFVAP